MIKTLYRYIDKWWVALILFLIISLAGIVFAQVQVKLVKMWWVALTLISMIGMLATIVFQFIRRRWLNGLFSFLSFVIALILIVTSYIFYGFFVSKDGFANNLTIPENIEIYETTSWNINNIIGDNSYQEYIFNSLNQENNDSTSIVANVSSIIDLHDKSQDVFLKYITTSPTWRVFKERGHKFATRRWNINSNWIYSLHGYYTHFDLYLPNDSTFQFQNRFTIGLSNKTWARNLNKSIKVRVGATKELTFLPGNYQYKSLCVLESDNIVIEIFDQSPFRGRKITQAAINYSEKEFKKLLSKPSIETVRSIIPNSSIRFGKPIFELHESMQPGIYDSEIWINPREAGMIYLKAYEITKNNRLSANKLKKYSNEWVGWSDNSNELFYSNTHFTIFEGDSGKPYAARFEIWFVPDSGGKERILMEKNFKIEGWQR